MIFLPHLGKTYLPHPFDKIFKPFEYLGHSLAIRHKVINSKAVEAKDMIQTTNTIACYFVIFWAKPLSVFNKPKTLNKDNRIPKYLICNRFTFNFIY
jgi:hypothetical protein